MKRILAVLLSFLLLTLTLTSCSGDIVSKIKEYDTDSISSSVTDANTKFAFDIFRKLNQEDSDKSIFISPLSISYSPYNGL